MLKIARGSAISLAMTYYTELLLLFAYIRVSGIYLETWAGMFACLSLRLFGIVRIITCT